VEDCILKEVRIIDRETRKDNFERLSYSLDFERYTSAKPDFPQDNSLTFNELKGSKFRHRVTRLIAITLRARRESPLPKEIQKARILSDIGEQVLDVWKQGMTDV